MSHLFHCVYHLVSLTSMRNTHMETSTGMEMLKSNAHTRTRRQILLPSCLWASKSSASTVLCKSGCPHTRRAFLSQFYTFPPNTDTIPPSSHTQLACRPWNWWYFTTSTRQQTNPLHFHRICGANSYVSPLMVFLRQTTRSPSLTW